jgi:hypothetical protein
MSLKIGIFNGLEYHYEIMGFIILWCKKYNHKLTIYTTLKSNMGWLTFYKCNFQDRNFYFNISETRDIIDHIPDILYFFDHRQR